MYAILVLALILGAAALAGHAAARVGQPPVLGELVVGVLLGNLGLAGVHILDAAPSDATLQALAQVGVLLLLFQVGLESTVREMLQVGGTATVVAVLGVAAPFALGWGVGAWLLPAHSPYAHAYLGATLTATSVGITARVLSDLGAARTREARVILGAAVIDDVLGLVILAIVSGAIAAAGAGETLAWGAIVGLVAKAAGLLVGAALFGEFAAPGFFRLASRLRKGGPGVLLSAGLVICFTLSGLAAAVGLAPIVGAYAAGLVLEEAHWREFPGSGARSMEELVRPVTALLVPVFFVTMGMRVDLRAFAHPGVLGLAAALTAAAIAGKQACGLGALGRGLDARSIGIGMIPRGEVGLIFAGVGLTLTLGTERIIDPAVFSAVVIMVIVTTLLTPPALKWSLARRRRTTLA